MLGKPAGMPCPGPRARQGTKTREPRAGPLIPSRVDLRSGPGHAQVPSGKVLETPRKQGRAGLFPALEGTLHTQEVPRAGQPRPQAAPLKLPRTLGTKVMHQPRGTVTVTGRAGRPFRSCNLNPEAPSFLEVDPRQAAKRNASLTPILL